MNVSLSDALTDQRWEKALFTTYSLSLTFFESIVLRALREVECPEIWVVADAEGYRSSLMERGSHGVGYEYHLVPIGLRNGVFHPKCSYLAGPDSDLLVVGSGNLTFGGFGRNLEVIEVLSSQSDSLCFREFGIFLNGLKRRTDIVCPDLGWIDAFAARATAVGRVNQASNFPSLLTSVEESVEIQLSKVVSSLGGAQHLTLLSPFFDPDGRAVLALAKDTKVSQVRIALPPSGATTCFPFPASRRWSEKLSAVELDAGKERRKLHAKWIEWKTKKGILSFTGSVNATHQSLCTTKNIEVGVLRFDASGNGWATWRKTANPSSYESLTYRQAGIGESSLVFAELRDSGELKGRLLTLLPAKGIWSGKIEKASGESIEIDVTVDSEGRFSHYLTNADEFLYASGLQIRLKANGREARGWIQNAAVLNLPKLHRLPLPSLLRLINRDETEEDNIALLEYFALHASEHLRTFRSRVSVANTSENEQPEDQGSYSIDLESLTPSGEIPPSNRPDVVAKTSTEQALDQIFAQLRKRLLGHASPRRQSGWTHEKVGSDDVVEEQVADEDLPASNGEEEKLADALDSFTNNMQSIVRAADLSSNHRRAILVLWLEVMLHMLVRRRRDRAGAGAFLWTWFQLTSSLTTVEGQPDGLEQHFVTVAAILVALDSDGASSNARVLHEALEHYWRGTVDVDRAHKELHPYSPLGLTGLFFDQEKLNLHLFLTNVLEAETLRQELCKILELHKNGSSLPENSPVFQTDAGQALLKELQQENHVPRYAVLKGASMLCPRDYTLPSEIFRSDLEKHRIALCSSCGLLVLRVDP
jgi:hypothetical protein